MVVLRGAQAVELGPHLSHLIYIYMSKITKYMYMVQCPIHHNRKVNCYTSSRALWNSLVGSSMKSGATSVWRIWYPHEIVIHIFTKAHILFCLPCSRYTLVFPRLACRPRGTVPADPYLRGPAHTHTRARQLVGPLVHIICFREVIVR
jgi:hypothetical protein